MRVPAAIGELWGLFVDDGSLAAGLVLWCAAVAALLEPGGAWGAVALFAGCTLILLENVWRSARRAPPAKG